MSDHYAFYNPNPQHRHEQHPQQYHQQLLDQQQQSPPHDVQQQQQQQQQHHHYFSSQPHANVLPGAYHPQSSQNLSQDIVPGFSSAPRPPTLNTSDYAVQPYYDKNGQLLDSPSGSASVWFEQDAEISSVQMPKSAVRMRRRAPAGADHVKHRRTRSGCYTCRSRRVKCDETHPVCERCKKGSRECVYPEPTSTTKPTSGSKLGQSSKPGDESGSSEGEEDDEEVLESPIAAKPSKVEDQGPKSQETVEKSLSPSTATDESVFSRSGKPSLSPSVSYGEASWSHLPADVQFYLDYHRTHLNHNYYFFKHDPANFVHDILLNEALQYVGPLLNRLLEKLSVQDPLLYAVVGFAAYHCTIKKAKGKLSDFLSYYNKSVSMLRKSLQSNQKHTVATILTILQLAAFEEYLGDWVNLMAHQKAAYEMINELYSPETIMQDDTSRKMFDWYARFDLFAGLLAGNPTSLSNAWFEASIKWYEERSKEDPSDVDMLLESLFAAHRYMGVEMAQLFGKLPKGEITIEDFMEKNAALSSWILDCKARLDPLVESPDHKVMSFEGAPELDADNIVDPYQPGRLFAGPLFSANYMLMDWYAIDAMHKYQTSQVLQQPPPAELYFNSIEQCRIIEAMDLWPGSPLGAIMPVQASLGITCLFLPRDERHSLWCRKKFVKLEANGLIFPPVFRTKMAELWSMPSLHHWWLDDEEGYPSIIKAIRSFIEERTIQPRTQVDQDLRTMKALFAKLGHDDSPKASPESMTSSTNDSGSGRLAYGSPQSVTSGSQHET